MSTARNIAVFLVAAVIVVGGGVWLWSHFKQAPDPTPNQQVGGGMQMPGHHSIDLFGGRYFLDIETEGSLDLSSRVDHRASGAETIVQLAEYGWGENKLKIDKGSLTFNGKEYGTLQPGDRVHIDKNGLLSINEKHQP
jgi:hypothetical protein